MRLSFALLATLLLACGGPVDTELLEIDSLSPASVQPGHHVAISGSGFPTGRTARVTLEGTLHRPGEPSRELHYVLEGRAVDEQRIEIAFPGATLRALGGRGTFRGAARVAFDGGALGAGDVTGVLREVVLDLCPGGTPPPGEPAEELSARVGFELAPREDDGEGLRIARVVPGSRAADAGLVEGDHVLASSGVRLLRASDFLPPPGVDALALDVQRDDAAQPFTVAVDLRGLDDAFPAPQVRLVQLAALVWIAALLAFGPARTLLRRAASRRPGAPRIGPIALAALAALALRSILLATDVGLESVVVALAAARGALVVSLAEARGPALARGTAGLVALAVTIACASVALGSSSPSLLEAAQGPMPWEWSALRSPAGSLAVLLLVLGAACGPIGEPSPRWRALDGAILAALATCAVMALAGGASALAVIADVRPSLAPLGWVPFTLVTTLVTALLVRARDLSLRTGPLAAVTIAASALTSTTTVGWMELAVPPQIERALAEVLVAGAALVALRLVMPPRPEPTVPHHALL